MLLKFIFDHLRCFISRKFESDQQSVDPINIRTLISFNFLQFSQHLPRWHFQWSHFNNALKSESWRVQSVWRFLTAKENDANFIGGWWKNLARNDLRGTVLSTIKVCLTLASGWLQRVASDIEEDYGRFLKGLNN